MEPSIKISSKVNSFEIVSKIEEAIRVFFPSWINNEYSENIEKFPSKRVEFTLIDEIDSLEIFFQKIREQKILDTAFDVMTINLKNDKTNFIFITFIFTFSLIWQARRASNPQPSVLETDTLPIELLA